MIELDEALQAAVGAAFDRGYPFVLGTVDAEGQPHLAHYGTVQALDGQRLGLWTRRPEGLVGRITANPRVALSHWDPQARLLLRFEGRAHVATDEATRTAIFEGSPTVERERDPDRTGVAVVVELTRVRGVANGQRFEMQADPPPA